MKNQKDGKETIERRAHARASGRGKLYHADTLDEWQAVRAAEVADAVKNGHPVPMPLRPREALRMARRAAGLKAQLAAELEDHALDMASIQQCIGEELACAREQQREAAEYAAACVAERDEAQAHAYRLDQQKRRAQGGRKKSAASTFSRHLRNVLFEKWEDYRKECRGKRMPTYENFLDEKGESPVIVEGNVRGSVIDYLKKREDVEPFLKMHRQNLRNMERREMTQKPKPGKR